MQRSDLISKSIGYSAIQTVLKTRMYSWVTSFLSAVCEILLLSNVSMNVATDSIILTKQPVGDKVT